jgi:hypothetical protein
MTQLKASAQRFGSGATHSLHHHNGHLATHSRHALHTDTAHTTARSNMLLVGISTHMQGSKNRQQPTPPAGSSAECQTEDMQQQQLAQAKGGTATAPVGSARLPHTEQTGAHSTDITAVPTTPNQPKLHDVHNTHAKQEKRIMQPVVRHHQPLDSLYTTMHGIPHKQHEERRLRTNCQHRNTRRTPEIYTTVIAQPWLMPVTSSPHLCVIWQNSAMHMCQLPASHKCITVHTNRPC